MKPRISVAEDDLGLSETLQLLLEDEGYEEAEADDFLLKPFNINKLLALIEKYVS